MAGATSNGAWAGDNPINFALPLLIIQLCLILFFSRILAAILHPLRQPRVIAEICGGILLGASVLGNIPHFTEKIFPSYSLTVLNSLANLGLLFFLFTVGLELDIRSLKETGRSAMIIALAGIATPFALGAGASFAIREILNIDSKFGPFVVFMGVAMSITAFPVLARILAERKLLTTDVGQMAMSAAAVNDVLAWVLLALAVALSASDADPKVVAWILLCGVAFVLIMFLAVSPIMAILCKRVVDNEPVPEWLVALTLVGVLVSGFCTDVIGIHGIFGAFVFGLILPKDGPFATIIIEKIEDITSIVLLPLYFASSGLSVRLQDISSAKSALVVVLVIGVACIGKIGGTMVTALLTGMPVRKSLAMGILMNTKGLVELIVLNIGLQKEVINRELYTIMVIMALVTTFMTTPLIMLVYEPAREKVPYMYTKVEGGSKDGELRLLVCVHGMKTIPGMLNLTEIVRGSRKKPLAAFLLHLVEFSERSSAIMMVTRVRKDGKPFFSKEAEREGRDQVAVAYQAYARLSKVQVQTMTAISAFFNMHEDVCGTASDKRANLIIVPYHKYMGVEGKLDTGIPGFRTVNMRVMRAAPCSVALLVDRGLGLLGRRAPGEVASKVAILFFGGPDDREALAVGLRMAEHPGIELTVISFVPKDAADLAIALAEREASKAGAVEASSVGTEITRAQSASSFIITTDRLLIDNEAKLDIAALAPAREKANFSMSAEAVKAQGQVRETGVVVFQEREVQDASSAALAVTREEFDLLVLGRGRRPCPLVALLAHTRVHSNEEVHRLGPVGDTLVAHESEEQQPSLLIVQQHDPNLVKTAKGHGEDSSHHL